MKRILSIFLTVAMLISMLAMAVSAYDEDLYNSITAENQMSFKVTNSATGEETTTFKPGDEIHIAAHMDSVWGDPDIEDDIVGYEGNVLPGAHGMAGIAGCLVFPLENFTPKAATDIKSLDSTINNSGIDPTTDLKYEMTVTKTALSDAKKGGYYSILTESDTFNGDEDRYTFFSGSGDLAVYKLIVNENATPGTYKLPIGAYCITDLKTGAENGLEPKYEFFGQWYADIGHTDSQLKTRTVNFVSPTGENVNDDPTNGAYITITIAADVSEEDVTAAAEVDALIDAIGTDIWAAGNALRIDAVNNDGLYTHTGDTDAIVKSQNFSIKFKMMPGTDNADGFGFFGGWTDWNGGADVIFWNNEASKFMIGCANGPVNCTEVTSVKAESPALELPAKEWTDVEFIYNGSYMAVKVNGVIVCSTNNASTGYNFYIFYPSDVDMYITDMFVGDYDYDAFLAGANGAYTAVSLDSGAAIVAAETAYAALSTGAQTLVTKYDALVAARAEYDALLNSNEGATMIAGVVEDMIANIGEVLYNPWDAAADSGAKIVAAETAYAALTDEGKAAVSNYETLTAARAEYDAQIEAFDKACAYDVDVLIDAIGEVNFESRAAIEAAEAAYEALNDTQKSYVTKYDVLVAARATYDQYAPIMEVEVLADALGSDFFQGHYGYQSFTSTNGYADVKVTDDNMTGDFELTFDFVYTAANLHETDDSGIALFRSDATYAGYNFKLGAFIVGKGGAFMSGNKTPEVIASTEYDLVEGKVYNMTIKFEGTVASVYLDGELMVTADGGAANYDYTIFYPMNVNVYFGDSTLTSGDATVTNGIRWAAPIGTAGIDVLAPVDITAKLEAAEAALAALDADQLALLDDKYEAIIAEARVNYDAKLAEIQAAAGAVEAKIAAIATEDDANAARAAYQALTPGAQTLVENYADLNNALANITIGYIDAIGEVTPASEAAIAKAEAAYGALTPAERELVTNYDVLTAARKEITDLNNAVYNAMTKINMLQAGGSAIVNNADGGSVGSYSQYLDNAENLAGGNAVAEYAFSFDIYVDRLNDETNAYFGGSSSNNVFVGYDLVRKTVFVANDGPWGYNSAAQTVIAEAEFDLQLQTWYDFKFVMGETTAQIYVDGELVLETAITEPNGWFIYYPKNNVAYYDNVEFWYNGEKQTSMADFASVGAGNWTALSPAGDPGYYLTTTAPVGPVEKDADLIAAARAAYDAVPAKAQYAVANYAVLVEAETPDEPVITPSEEVQAIIDALDVPATNLDNIADVLANADAIEAALAAYNALSDEDKALVDKTALDAALAAYNKALIYDYVLNSDPVAPQNVTATDNGDNTVTLTWDAVDGAAKYWIYRDGVVVAATTDTSYVVKATTGDHIFNIRLALAAPIEGGAAYAAGISADVAVTVAEPAPLFVLTDAGVVDGQVVVDWTDAEGATKYWIVFTSENGTVYTFATTESTFSRKVAPFVGNYDVVVKALVDGKIIDSEVKNFAC